MKGKIRHFVRLNKKLTTVGIVLALLLLGAIAALAAEYFINTEGQTEEINEALFIGFFPDTPTGTGNFDPFLRISQSNLAVVKGFNTDAEPQFQEDDTWTSAQNVSEIPVIAFEYDGVVRLYREVQLDINQNAGGDGRFLSLDVVEIYITEDPDLTGYDPTTKFGANATLVYDMDELEDNWLKFDYTNNNGSGKRDMKMLIPNEWLTDDPRCAYQGPVPDGSPPSECPYFFVMYNEFGANYDNNDGFEEWGSEIYPVASKTGYKYNDLNKNGDRDEGEPGLEGWTIYVDLNNDGDRDPGEPFAVTGETGFYEIQYIIPNPTPEDTWIVREEQQSGWYCSEPALSDEFGCYYDENFAADEIKTGNDFGNYQLVLDVTKDATTTFTRTYNWSIAKDYDATYSKFIGDPATTHDYEVTVTKTGFTDSAWAVSGSIYIVNNMPVDATVSSVSDLISGGINATVSCPGGLPQTVAADGGSLTCTYSSDLPDGADRLNTATVATTGEVAGNSATADVTFGDPTTEVRAQINVSDTNGQSWGPVSNTTTWTYNRNFECSSGPADYPGGFYSFSHDNTATIVETGQSDDATVTVNCYAPVLSKDASASYDERHDWNIIKTVDPESQGVFAGDPVDWTWTIEIEETVVDQNFAVSGDIDVSNPAGSPGDMLVSLVDELDDGTPVTVDCGDGTASVTVAPGATESCSYSASPADDSATLNTATGTFNGIGGFVATAPVSFVTNVVNDSATFSDPYLEIGDTVVTDPSSTDYPDGDVCSNDPDDYGDNGMYTVSVDNTGYLVDEEGTEYSDGATTTYTCYAPVLSKTASASYDERHDWNIIKTVDPESQGVFAGDPVDWTWTIEIEETVVDENFAVSGDIDVSNPAGSPGDMLVSLVDELDDGTPVTVDCGGGTDSVTVAPGATESCSYSASPADDSATLNTATGTFNGIGGFVATAPVSFVTNVVNDSATFSDPDLGIGDTLVTDPSITDYPDGDDCSNDPDDYGDNGMYTVSVDNTGYLVDEEGTEYSDGATTTYTCYAPVLDKTASASYDERHDWNIIKTVDPESQDVFAGDPVDWTWTIEIEETVVDENFAVSGDIDVSNPAGSPGDMLVSLVDELSDGTPVTVDCGGGTDSVTVAPGATESCSYSASPADDSATLNTATGTFNGIGGFVATAPVSFVTNVVNDSATFSDPDLGIGDTLVTDPSITDYPDGDDCSNDPDDYGDNGMYTVSVDNTGYLVDEEGTEYSDGATTTYTCYAPVLSKTASASYDERHTWDIEKSVNPTSQSGYTGDTLSWTWTVNLSESSVDENFAVSGDIDVSNPAGSPGDMLVSLVDELSDGTPVTVDCGGGTDSVTVAPGATESCSYSASPLDASATLNTATGTFNGIGGFVATADVNFIANVINGTADVDDDQEPDFPLTLNAGEGPWTWTETQSHTCSTSSADYGADGNYSATLYNTASVTGNDGQYDEASANTTYTCEAGFMNLLKLTDGVVNPAKDWSFALYEGPDGFGGTLIGSSSTWDDPDGVLEFGNPTLRPDMTYTVCELGVPAGWATEWKIDTDGNGVADTIVPPYNPNSDDVPPADVGNRCFDFGAGTSYPVQVGETLVFQVNNTFPGGEPRTPGYWKNWNTCTPGNQSGTAAKNGGPDEGWYILDDILNDPGISWGNFAILTCEDGVSILDQRDIVSGKKKASDAAYTLAMHLLAAQLNFAAGAETCQAAMDAASAGEALLVSINFNGTGNYLRPKNPLYQTALNLAYTLDQYNNGYLCSP